VRSKGAGHVRKTGLFHSRRPQVVISAFRTNLKQEQDIILGWKKRSRRICRRLPRKSRAMGRLATTLERYRNYVGVEEKKQRTRGGFICDLPYSGTHGAVLHGVQRRTSHEGPVFVFRNWSWYSIIMATMYLAKREGQITWTDELIV